MAGRTFSSMKTSLMRLLTTVALTSILDLDHSTIPEVVTISKASNILLVCQLFNKLLREGEDFVAL